MTGEEALALVRAEKAAAERKTNRAGMALVLVVGAIVVAFAIWATYVRRPNMNPYGQSETRQPVGRTAR